MTIGNRIRAERKSQYLTLQDIQDKTGLSKSTISAIERDIGNPTLNTITKVAKALGMNIQELMK